MDGGIACAWETFGGIATQLTHLGRAMDLVVAKIATTEMTYAKKSGITLTN